jgi:hypothetical protein
MEETEYQPVTSVWQTGQMATVKAEAVRLEIEQRVGRTLNSDK